MGWVLVLTLFLFRCNVWVSFILCVYNLKKIVDRSLYLWGDIIKMKREFLSNQGTLPILYHENSSLEKACSKGTVNLGKAAVLIDIPREWWLVSP